MTRYVLDSSALIALINKEPGSERVKKALSGSIMSAVNVSEVVAVLIRLSIPQDKIQVLLTNLVHAVIPFNEEQAFIAGYLYSKGQGLSLGDRACLSLGKTKNMPVLTSDRKWAEVDCGVQVEIFR